MGILKAFYCQKIMESKIQQSLIRRNFKVILIEVIAIVCVDDKFSKAFKTYLDEDVVYNFINNIIKDSKYCNNAIKNILTKKVKILKTLLNVGSVPKLIMMLRRG